MDKTSFVDQLRSHWFIIIALCAGCVTWGITTNQLANAQEDQKKVEARVLELERQQQVQREAVARIDENTKAAKEAAQRVESRVDELIRALRDQ